MSGVEPKDVEDWILSLNLYERRRTIFLFSMFAINIISIPQTSQPPPQTHPDQRKEKLVVMKIYHLDSSWRVNIYMYGRRLLFWCSTVNERWECNFDSNFFFPSFASYSALLRPDENFYFSLRLDLTDAILDVRGRVEGSVWRSCVPSENESDCSSLRKRKIMKNCSLGVEFEADDEYKRGAKIEIYNVE